jgi:PAS domain S-box-containing protein
VFELANAAYDRLVGHRPLIGRTVRAALPEIGDRYFQLLDDVLASGRPFVGNSMVVTLSETPGGPSREVFVDFVYQPIFDQEGRALGVMVLGHDITEEVATRRRAAAAQAELEAIFESFPEALYAGDASGIKRTNAAAQKLLGYPSLDLMPRSQPLIAEELRARHADGAVLASDDTPWARALRGLSTRTEVVLSRYGTGEERVVLASAAPVRVGGEITGAVVTHVDVTERRRAEAQSFQLARVLDATREFVGIAELDGRPTFVNEAGRKLIGLADLDAARALPLLEYFVERQRARVADEVLPAALRDGYWEGELLFRHQQTGEEIPVLYSVFPVRGEAGAVTALATITRDLRAVKAAEAELARLHENERAARAQAEQANLLRDQFLATVSHELRTPLTAILGWMQMLRSGALAPEKRARALEVVERNARVQAQLIEDLLDVSRIISGKLPLDVVRLDVASVVGAAVETVRPMAEGKGVRLEVAIESTAQVMGDSRRLQQVVWNLLSNAVKFSASGTVVVLRLERLGDRVEIEVRDQGAGIRTDFLPHVFEIFRQAEVGTSRRMGGLGLGLSIVQHVVTAHGGEVRAFSEGEGKGATFLVRLPLAGGSGKAVVDAVPYRAERTLAGMVLLVVDDEEDTREYLRALLEQAGAQVLVAASAAEALTLVQRQRPDVLLSDLAMPGQDGYWLLDRVRSLPAGPGGPIKAVALTAHARTEDRDRALAWGFEGHVTKPVDPAELVAVVQSLKRSPKPRRVLR